MFVAAGVSTFSALLRSLPPSINTCENEMNVGSTSMTSYICLHCGHWSRCLLTWLLYCFMRLFVFLDHDSEVKLG